MLRLDLSNAPHWLELMQGLRVQLSPLTTALMVSIAGLTARHGS